MGYVVMDSLFLHTQEELYMPLADIFSYILGPEWGKPFEPETSHNTDEGKMLSENNIKGDA